MDPLDFAGQDMDRVLDRIFLLDQSTDLIHLDTLV